MMVEEDVGGGSSVLAVVVVLMACWSDCNRSAHRVNDGNPGKSNSWVIIRDSKIVWSMFVGSKLLFS